MNDQKTILVTGASGLVGVPLSKQLRAAGHTVKTLSRSNGDFQWDPLAGELPLDAVGQVDAVVHLAGETVAQRWTGASRKRIRDSRVEGTRLLVRRILEAGSRPAFISASGINYYGYDRDHPVDESSETGEGFLAEVCREWEAALQPLADTGIRCVFLRTGVVLSRHGGALAKLLPPFKAGLGGRVGNGRQMMSWVALEDLVRIYLACIDDSAYSGPVNAVAPEPVANQQFAQSLGKVIGRPAIVPTPALAIRALFGEMGRETVLSNLSVIPKRLNDHAFQWKFPELEGALHNILQT